MRHPRNQGERLALNRHLQVSGRDHRGRASRNQKIGTSIKRQTRKLNVVEYNLDYISDLEPPSAPKAKVKNFASSIVFTYDGRVR